MITFRAMHPVSQGTVGLGVAIGYFTKNGYSVSVPLNDNQKYDLVVDDGRLHRVQVKTTRQRSRNGRHYVVELKSVRPNKTRNTIFLFDKSVVEYVFVLAENEDQYLIPANEVSVHNSLTLDSRYDRFKVN